MADPQIAFVGCADANYEQGRQGQQVRALVEHLMAGTLEGTDEYYLRARPLQPTSAHYGVGKNGEIHQYVRDEDTAYSNGILIKPNYAAAPWLRDAPWPKPITANHFTISIEHEGNHVWEHGLVGGTVLQWWQPTEAQYQASLWLNNMLAQKHGIAIKREYIMRHSDFNSSMAIGGKGWCPGQRFNMTRLLSDLTAMQPAPVINEYRFVQPPTISLPVFEQVLRKYNSPALTDPPQYPASLYYNLCTETGHGINPAVALAFFVHESQCGTDGVAVLTKSWGNVRTPQNPALVTQDSPYHDPVNGDFAKYPTFLDSLRDWILRILGPKYLGSNPNLSLHDAIQKYAPASDKNDPESYYRTVMQLLATWAEASAGH